MRNAMFDAMREDYVRTARAKGLSERAVIWRHAVPNSLLPMVTLLGLYLPHLIGGSVIVERIFGIDGMGMLAFRAVLERDYDVVMGLTTLTALITLGAMLLSDLAYALVDPRIRVE
jgi:peptide/nickel transport system permease protein